MKGKLFLAVFVVFCGCVMSFTGCASVQSRQVMVRARGIDYTTDNDGKETGLNNFHVVIYDDTGKVVAEKTINKGPSDLRVEDFWITGKPPFTVEIRKYGYEKQTRTIGEQDNETVSLKMRGLPETVAAWEEKREQKRLAEIRRIEAIEEKYRNPVYTGTVDAFMDEVNSNKDAAFRKYRDKVVKLTGAIRDLSESTSMRSREVIIDLGGMEKGAFSGQSINSIELNFDGIRLPQDSFDRLKVGQTITVAGRYHTISMVMFLGLVPLNNLSDCRLAK
jgi:hypothetical protein